MAKDRGECGASKDGCYQLREAMKGLWGKIRTVTLSLILAFGMGTYLFGIDIISTAKDYPETKKKVQDHTTEIAVIKKGQEDILIAQNETNRLLRELLNKEKEPEILDAKSKK